MTRRYRTSRPAAPGQRSRVGPLALAVMRIAGLIAASVLVAGCSQSVGGDAERIDAVLTVTPSTTRAAPSTTSPTSTTPARPPGAGAPIADVIAWVEAGAPADAGSYHSATRDGVTTELGEDVAFVTPSGKANCMTDSKYSAGALACLVDLKNPPPRPDDAYGEWKGGWIDYDGTSVAVGSVHGDPGPFTAGSGPGTAVRPVTGLRRLPLPQRPGRAVLRELRPPIGGAVQRRRGATVRVPANRRRRRRRSARCSAAEHGFVRRIGVHDHRAELRNGYGPVHVRRRGRRRARRPGSMTGRRRARRRLPVDDRPSAS